MRTVRVLCRCALVALVASAVASAIACLVLWHAVTDLSPQLDLIDRAIVWTDADGVPLLVRAADDGQVRLPYRRATGNAWLELATIAAEDRRFREHRGVDLRAVGRAATANLRAMRVAEGASGLAMQTAKLLDPRPRTLGTKAIESIRALKLIRSVGHDRVLESYLTLAPFGGNRVGAEAAALAYFGRPTARLTIAECALLAGLPKAPERLRPDREPDAARLRRDEVLRRMHREGMIDDALLRAATSEPVRVRTVAFVPRHRAAALWIAAQRPAGGATTLAPHIQRDAESLAHRHADAFSDGVEAAVVVIDVERTAVVALAMSSDPEDSRHGWVPLFAAWRSPGSALKPFVYAAAFDRGILAPSSRLADRHTALGAWRPRNFDDGHRGETSVAEALRDSLNIPAIATLGAVGHPEAIALMERCGLLFRGDSAHTAGLSLAVGGAEVRLIELTNAMATIARGGVHLEARLIDADVEEIAHRALTERTCAALDWILSTHDRAPIGLDHLLPDERPWMMWKTGTSSGHRDAWAVGHNGRYAVGVWIGRPAGGGDARLVGALAAEPLMAELLASPSLRTAVARRAEAIDWTPRVPHALTESRLPPRLAAPRSGATYLAVEGTATIAVRLREDPRGGDGQWLLDRNLLAEPPRRLHLTPGAYELTYIDPDGTTETVRFGVVEP